MDIIRGRNAITGQPVEVIIEDQNIFKTNICEDKIDLPYISPGFLDMQVNGYYGIDYSLDNLDEDQILSLVECLGKSGTTRHVPTFVSMPNEKLIRNIQTIVKARKHSPLLKTSIVGLHIEGPFISREEGPRGAHDIQFVRNPDFDLFRKWQEAAEGTIKYITLAPELDGAIEFIEKAVASGVKAAIGHTAASPEQIRAAIKAGATLSTHLGNGSHTMLPRLRNYLWEQLAADELASSIICDSDHLPPAVVRVFLRTKGLERLILVSDGALLGGYPPGIYRWGNLDVQVYNDGHLGIPGTTILAGAAHLLDWDIAKFIEFTGHSLAETIRLCTSNPSRYLDLNEAPENFLKEGEMANFCMFYHRAEQKRLQILRTQLGKHKSYIEGHISDAAGRSSIR